jgi:hypothetical protein
MVMKYPYSYPAALLDELGPKHTMPNSREIESRVNETKNHKSPNIEKGKAS